MKLFLDTANIPEIRDGARLGVISGVTTNPSLASAEGIGDRESYKTAIREIADIIDGRISVEVVSLDVEGMVAEGRDIAEWVPDPSAKIPSTIQGIEAISVLAGEGIKINQTLCFSVNQALLGAQAGSTVVSPFIGRLDDIGNQGIDLIEDIATVYKKHNIETMVMAASIRHPLHCTLAAKAGAHISTIPYKVLLQMVHHPPYRCRGVPVHGRLGKGWQRLNKNMAGLAKCSPNRPLWTSQDKRFRGWIKDPEMR